MGFCPNCGAQTAEGTAACTSCGGALDASGAPKFKGTIMMGGSAQTDVEAMVAKAKAAVAARAAAPESAGQDSNVADMALKATVLGPMRPGSSPSFPHPLGNSPVAHGERAAPSAGTERAAPSAGTERAAPSAGAEPATLRQADVPLEFRDSLSDDPGAVKSGRGGLIVALVIVAILLVGVIATGVYFFVRSRAEPQMVPGQYPGFAPGQYPMAPVGLPPGMPGVPGAVPVPTPQMPGMPVPGLPAPVPPAQ